MLRTAKPWAPRTREPQLYRDLERSPWESTRLFFTSRTGGAFFSETSIFLLTEAVVTLAVYFFFFCSHLFALFSRSEPLEQASVTPVGDRS